ncbi:MAG TPA: glycosyl hydrolase family 79 C-terminal domain-containing protein [Bryobacteraceae bacterium]|jgi:hypothetical protein|nr:glycosyl hydrolase family 79 C-terminal domain-containing protein [Bryobacteraceae bacterium]
MHTNRREFLAGSTSFAALLRSERAAAVVNGARNVGRQVRVNVDTGRTLGMIPADFIGLGYEISSVARPGPLSGRNRTYVKLVQALGADGVIRVGGNTSDYSSFAPDGQAVSAPKATVVNDANLRELGAFLDATSWKLIWGLNLGSSTEQQVVEEARAVVAAVKDKLLAFEIGNEPDLFGRGSAHRAKGYDYDDYMKEYRHYKTAIRAKVRNAPFAGPDVASATDWVTRFATDERNDLKLLTHHYYRECANPASTLDKLLHPDPKLAPELEKLRAASAASHVPYRICETNSFCGGGRPGVSDTFGAALWVLDFMFVLACAGAAGVNIETGVNQLGFISSYSPIVDDEHGTFSAKPEYYGMLAFAQAKQGHAVIVDYDSAGVNLTAYAVLNDRNRLSVIIVNKDASSNADVRIATNKRFLQATALRLTAPSLNSKDGVMLGGSGVLAQGEWKPRPVEHLPVQSGECEIGVPAASAAIVKWEA